MIGVKKRIMILKIHHLEREIGSVMSVELTILRQELSASNVDIKLIGYFISFNF